MQLKGIGSSLLSGVLLLAASASANVKLPALFSEHMVLQRDMPIAVWGWADKQEKVTITIAGQSKSAIASDDRKWRVTLEPLKAGAALTMSVKGANELTVNDILVGEVWLGSGQSNMGFPVKDAHNFDAEAAEANHPKIRLFKVNGKASPTPQADCEGHWEVCSPATVGQFAAALYFFGREIHQKLDVPVGLISSAVGGTPIELWIRAEAQHATPELKGFFEAPAAKGDAAQEKAQYKEAVEQWKKEAAEAKAAGKTAPRRPREPGLPAGRTKAGELYNSKIAPLIPYTLRGVIWYQGEANTVPEKAPYYQYQLPLLVSDWRKQWQEGDLPFAWVQLPNFEGSGSDIPLVREGMLKTLKLPQTGMAIAIDVGESNNIHPKNKQEVGHRLALWALGTVYNQKVPATSGPLPEKLEIKPGQIVIHFSHADGGLLAKGGDLKGFSVAGTDKRFSPGTARIDGDTVVVSSPRVEQPAALRYAWENDPACNLYNGAGLPASPFRTDDSPATP